MSLDPTRFRPFARMGFGGGAASHFRPIAQPQWKRGTLGTVVFRSPGGFANFALSGITRDSAGVVLATCKVELFTGGNRSVAVTVSGADGSFSFSNPGSGPFFLVAYKQGSPDVAGTTVNTLQPAVV